MHDQQLPLCSQVPEMQRSELAGTVLQLKALGIDNMMQFEWLAPPPAEAMVRALELLHALGALGDDARSGARITCQPSSEDCTQFWQVYQSLAVHANGTQGGHWATGCAGQGPWRLTPTRCTGSTLAWHAAPAGTLWQPVPAQGRLVPLPRGSATGDESPPAEFSAASATLPAGCLQADAILGLQEVAGHACRQPAHWRAASGACRLTRPLGFNMSELPVDPRLARALVASTGSLACSQEVATIVALLGVQHIWGAGRGQWKALDAAKARCVGVCASAAGGDAGGADCWMSSTAEMRAPHSAVRGTVLNLAGLALLACREHSSVRA